MNSQEGAPALGRAPVAVQGKNPYPQPCRVLGPPVVRVRAAG